MNIEVNFGTQTKKLTGYKTHDWKKGWRIDYDDIKGAHINWWDGNKKGAVLFDSGEHQVEQIIENNIIEVMK